MSFMRKALILIAFGAAIIAPAVAMAQQAASAPAAEVTVKQRLATDDGVLVARLSNGMTVIIKPVRHLPVVHVRATVHTGGMYEGKWLGTGISHLTEHLVAKGAVHDMGAQDTAAEAKQTSGRIDEIGGQSNAATSMERTFYYISAASAKAMDCIDLVADWMARPDIRREDFEREHGVVQRELEMGKDNPDRQMWYAHSANVFRNHPASVPVIGYPEPLPRLTYKDVLDYQAQSYVPQNMIFTVVGDVDAEAALARVLKGMQGFATGREFVHKLPEVEPFSGVRRVVQTNPNVKEVSVSMSFQTIPLQHEDLYALDVLSYILSQGRSSRLVEAIQNQQKLVTRVDTGSWTPDWGTGIFDVSYRALPDNADQAEAAILAELKRVVDEGVGAAELERAKRQKSADFVYGQQSIESIAATLSGDYMSTGDVSFSRNYTQRIQKVTAQQVQQAARKYFTFDRMVITRLEPAGKGAAATTGPSEQSVEAPKAQLLKLPNGLRVVLQPVPSSGLVSMAYVSMGGLLLEDENTNGLGNLMARLSTRGAEGFSREEIARFFDNAGGGIAGEMGNNSFYWQATVLQDSWPKALDILAAVVKKPAFDEKELEIVRPLVLAAIDRQDEQLMGQLMRNFRATFFANSPYGMQGVGTKEVVADATTEQLAQWHRKVLKAGSGVLAIYGSFDADAARTQVEKLFADVPSGQVELKIDTDLKPAGAGKETVIKTDNESAAVIVAAPGMTLHNLDDRFAMDVLDTIISGYQLPSGWMHRDLRGRQLVYVVHSYDWLGVTPGAFITYAVGQPANMPQIVEIIKANMAKASSYEPSQQEIDRAVNTILTAELLGKQSLPSLALEAALDEVYGLGYDFRSKMQEYYGKVTPADVLRVGKKYLSGEYSVTITTPLAQQEQSDDE